jgi:hypothetical protein
MQRQISTNRRKNRSIQVKLGKYVIKKEPTMRKLFFLLLFSAILFFQFTGFVHGAIPASERAALIAFYNAAGLDTIYSSNWKQAPVEADGFAQIGTEGSWWGVTVTNDHVTHIAIIEKFVSGTISPELENLPFLELLILEDNLLSGPIPPELGNLSNLKELSLAYNRLTGSIPPELGNLSNLTGLGLTGNPLTGSIPPELGNLTNLTGLALGSTHISGNIPPELGNLTNLTSIGFGDMDLDGTLPTQLSNLVNLYRLDLGQNRLTGNLPTWIGDLTQLKYLHLNHNRFDGSLPTEIGNLTAMITLNLYGNTFIGEIPASIINLTGMGSWNTFAYNGFYSNDPAVVTFLNSASPGWHLTQTIAPSNVSAQVLSASRVRVKWTAITYNGGSGYYSIYYSTTSGGPWTLAGTTADKTSQAYTVTGLTTGTPYYFVITTQSDAHSQNTNTIISDYSAEVSATPQAPPPIVTYTLDVNSSPDSGVTVTVSPVDNSANGDGATGFTRTYNSGTVVTLTAPPTYNGSDFSKWSVAGTDSTNSAVQVTMDTDKTATAYYVAPPPPTPPEISLNRTRLDFGYVMGGNMPTGQTVSVSNSGGGTLNWTAGVDTTWLAISPASGAGPSMITVSVDATGLAAGTYSGSVTVSDPASSNLSQTVSVNLTIKEANQDQPPFGLFATPVDGSTVMSSIPVTGWALDDTGVEIVKIYRNPTDQEGEGLIYIGDADFVEGARPDVEQAYPGYPMNYRAGWGYMLLTNFLPDGGNGTFTLYAVATDSNGNTATLGAKTITCDNDNAVKPFGAIDTPTQGGAASGGKFINWGWVLTPQPNAIPSDGSTIDVLVDGVNIGSPTYNNYRSDIATLFPGYANSNGAVGYFYLDTTAYENGVHTIQWTASDNAGNSDGIGSRYFTIMNNNGSRTQAAAAVVQPDPGRIHRLPGISKAPVTQENSSFVIEEIEPVEINLGGTGIRGHLEVNGELRGLPIGSTFNRQTGTFYWSPGAGFNGAYRFVFIVKTPTGETVTRWIEITIIPKQ